MHALPGAAVHQMPAEQRLSRYMRLEFDTLEMGAGSGPGGLVRITGSPHPHIAARNELPQHGITVHILEPIEQIESLRRDAFVTFLLLAASGSMLIALVFGARAYVLRVREYRRNMEATNESLNRLNENLDRLARVDPLTGCANRRHFQERLEIELERARRYGRDCSLLVIDIDLFKKVNDIHGHAAGDEALRHFVRIVRGQLRNQDELGRMGGEEFTVLLPEAGLAGAVAVAERIRCAIEAAPAQFEDARIPLTASIGVACRKSPAEPADALVQRADKALYAAKSGGRNRVISTDGAAVQLAVTA
jgi:diguanylate cyclase (GGDEF)-like protein